ncbi:nuclear transport factor 2 family protein [Tomitella biformata]|uniref:nuclear transport factor 2 family protein n=1 Tax=Tomitella biformata TaxID=630403 RepID=UPI0004BCC725|nr:nuclear transport factor 2 family protein [Tomitella biformata]
MTHDSIIPISRPSERDLHEIRALVDAYAYAVDRRDEPMLAALLTPDAALIRPASMVGAGQHAALTGVRLPNEILAAVAHLRSTRHIVAQQVLLGAGTATTVQAETYCTAHHIYGKGDAHRDNRLHVRYRDTFVRQDGRWWISRRELLVDFIEDVPVTLPHP